MQDKATMRASVLAARARRPESEREVAGRALAELGVAAWADRRLVAAFASFGTEPPTGPLLAGLRAAGVTVLLPVVDANRMLWSPLDAPQQTPLAPEEIQRVELAVVPALAVDRQGNRLGRGRGYYDRALVGVTAPVVAVGYDEEFVERVPTEPHDRPVTGFLSPGGLIRCGQ